MEITAETDSMAFQLARGVRVATVFLSVVGVWAYVAIASQTAPTNLPRELPSQFAAPQEQPEPEEPKGLLVLDPRVDPSRSPALEQFDRT
jgi:hypothetical protein